MVLTIVAIALRGYYAQALYLNPDEAMQITAATAGNASAFHHPPLLYWILWLISFAGEQPWWLRLPSVLAGSVLPALVAIWLRGHVNVVTAWGLAALVAVLPNFVLLTMQIRGYAIALAAIVAAMIALDRAFGSLSRRWLIWHFLFLYLAILSEFMIVWAAIGLGCYALMHPSIRSLFRVWVAGQVVAVALYGALYLFVVVPIAGAQRSENLIQAYLAGAFPAAGQNVAVFVAIGVLKQFVYLAGGIPAGVIAFGLAALGIGLWGLRRDPRAFLCLMPFVAIAGAVLRVYPFGRSRHTVVIGLICLLAIAASIDWVGRRDPFMRWGLPAALLAFGLAFPMADIHNIPTEAWRAERLNRLETALRAKIPAGAKVVVDRETYRMFEFRGVPRSQRVYKRGTTEPLPVNGFTMQSARRNDALEGGGYWVLDAGFAQHDLKPPVGAIVEYDDPGVAVLYRVP